MQDRLSIVDVQRLLAAPTEEARIGIALKVGSQFRNVVLAPKERELAQQILGHLVHDVAVSVRQALSSCLSNLDDAPHDIILALARDLDEVALPVLENSSVLTYEDMVELVLTGSAVKQRAIAGRPELDATVSDAIAREGDRSAVIVLVANKGAIIRPDIVEKIVLRYPADEDVLSPIAMRDDLPATFVERVVNMVSTRMRDYLVERHGFDRTIAALLEEQSRERSVVAMMGSADPAGMPKLVAQLSEQRHLTPSLLLRAICSGEMFFVETAFAFLTAVPHERAARLIHDVGALGFRAVYARAGMPETLYPAFRSALDVVHEFDQKDASGDRQTLRHAMHGRVSAQYRDIEAKDIDGLIDKMTRTSRILTRRAGHAA